jgi:ABC-type sugar transport system permease subunit
LGVYPLFKRLTKNDKYAHYGYLFILPFFVVMAIFIIYPILNTFYLSFTKWEGATVAPKWIGLQNYKRLIEDITSGGLFLKSIKNTWILWICNAIPQFVGALALAVLLTDRHNKIKGKELFRAIFYLPNLITMASVGALFYFMLGYPSGTLNDVLTSLHILKEPFYFLQSVWATRLSVSTILTWMWFGYTMIIFIAGIKGIPEELFEAATVDGATKWQVFKSITLPQLRPIMTYQVVTSIIGGLSMYDIPQVLTDGTGAPLNSVTTMVMHIYKHGFTNYNLGYASTVAMGLFLHIFIVVAIAIRLINPKDS